MVVMMKMMVRVCTKKTLLMSSCNGFAQNASSLNACRCKLSTLVGRVDCRKWCGCQDTYAAGAFKTSGKTCSRYSHNCVNCVYGGVGDDNDDDDDIATEIVLMNHDGETSHAQPAQPMLPFGWQRAVLLAR